jgi:hypothetical protein
VLEQRVAIDRSRLRQVAEAREAVVDAPRVVARERPHDVALALEVAGVEAAQKAEVEQAQPPVRTENAVVRVRVAGDGAVAPHEAEVEAEGDLADAVALRVAELLDLVATQPLDVLGHKHAARREVRVHAWQPHVRVAAEQPLEAALVGLELVVQLVRDPLADPRPAPHPRRVRAQGAR